MEAGNGYDPIRMISRRTHSRPGQLSFCRRIERPTTSPGVNATTPRTRRPSAGHAPPHLEPAAGLRASVDRLQDRHDLLCAVYGAWVGEGPVVEHAVGGD